MDRISRNYDPVLPNWKIFNGSEKIEFQTNKKKAFEEISKISKVGLPLLRSYSAYYNVPSDQDELYASHFDAIFNYFQATGKSTGSPDVHIGVIDSGYNDNTLDTYTNYRADLSYDTYNNVPKNVKTYNTHGTKIIGLLSADHNGVGMDGFVPGCTTSMYKIADEYGLDITTESITAAIDKAIANGAKIITLAVGTSTDDPQLKAACLRAKNNNVLIVAAVANNGLNETVYPAGYSNELDNVIAVGALAKNSSAKAGFSSYGSYVDVYAQGENIKTPSVGYSGSGSFVNSDGASFASAIVTATAAHMLSQNSSLKPADIKELIKKSAGKDYSDPTIRYVRPFNAVQYAASFVKPVDDPLFWTINGNIITGTLGSGINSYQTTLTETNSFNTWKLADDLNPANINGNTLFEIDPYYGVNSDLASAGLYWFNMELNVNLNGQEKFLLDRKLVNYVPNTTCTYTIGDLDVLLKVGDLHINNLIGHTKFVEEDINGGTFTVKVTPGYDLTGWNKSETTTYSNCTINSLGSIVINIAATDFRPDDTDTAKAEFDFRNTIQTAWNKAKSFIRDITWKDVATVAVLANPLAMVALATGCGGGGGGGGGGGTSTPTTGTTTNKLTSYKFEIIRNSDNRSLTIEKASAAFED